nr:MAG TPA: hypothetical protein [Caudoviricetes sp.]
MFSSVKVLSFSIYYNNIKFLIPVSTVFVQLFIFC